MPELAEARGVRAQRMELLFLIVVALATSMTLPVVGALLIFSLMIGPPAAARSVTDRPLPAMLAFGAHRAGRGVGVDRRGVTRRTGRSGSSSAHSGRPVTRPGRGWAAIRRRRSGAAGHRSRAGGPRGAQEHGLQAANVRV